MYMYACTKEKKGAMSVGHACMYRDWALGFRV
jgi:hypothetical protein